MSCTTLLVDMWISSTTFSIASNIALALSKKAAIQKTPETPDDGSNGSVTTLETPQCNGVGDHIDWRTCNYRREIVLNAAASCRVPCQICFGV